MRISDWSSDVCSSDLLVNLGMNLLLDQGEARYVHEHRAVLATLASQHTGGACENEGFNGVPQTGGQTLFSAPSRHVAIRMLMRHPSRLAVSRRVVAEFVDEWHSRMDTRP